MSSIAARAQQLSLPKIGYLEGASQEQFSHLATLFQDGLHDTGYVVGQNVTIDFRWADGQYDKLPALAAELVRGHASLIFTTAYVSALAAKAATTTIPIVFVSGPDPVELGLVARLNRPGGNLTGVTLFTSTVAVKRVELLLQLSPTTSTFAFIVNPSNTRTESDIKEMEAAALALNIKIVVHRAGSDRDLDEVWSNLDQQHIRAAIVGGDPFFNSRAQQLVALASRYAIPTIYPLREFPALGGLISYGSSISAAYRQAGVYAGKVLKGTKPADLPIVQPTKFELVINLKTAKSLGLDLPPTLLARAEEVIE